MNNVDKEYFRLLNLILDKGKLKKNRTGIDTIGVFGEQAKFDIDLNAFPILTTKRVWFKGILHELLWFIKGDTNIKYLVDNDVHIWDDWCFKRYVNTPKKELTNQEVVYGRGEQEPGVSGGGVFCDKLTQEEFILKIKNCKRSEDWKDESIKYGWDYQEYWRKDYEFAVKWGELGEGTYGGMWRNFPYYDNNQIDPQVNYVDQIQKVIDKLKTNPDDRRMIVSAWHPYWVDHCALPPCHVMFHFNTEELTEDEQLIWAANHDESIKMNVLSGWTGKGLSDVAAKLGLNIPKRKLNCLLYQRSCDIFLGVPFNITSYCLLTAMVAHCVDMIPGTFTHTYGDLHIYTNHLEQVKIQLSRESKKLPSLLINPDKKDLFDMKYEDIKLQNYEFYPTIKAEVAV